MNLFKEGENDANLKMTMDFISSFDKHYIDGWDNGLKDCNRGLVQFYIRRLKGLKWASPRSHRVVHVEAHILFIDDGRLRPKLIHGPRRNFNWNEVLGLIPINARLNDRNAINAF